MLELWLAIFSTAAAMHVSTPAWSTRLQPALALADVFFAYFAFDAVAPLFLADPDGEEQLWAWACVCGAVVLQPMIIGAWTILAKGSMLTRLPIVLPSLMLLFLAPVFNPTLRADVPGFEYIALVLAGFTAFFLTLLLFLLARRFLRIRIDSKTHKGLAEPANLQFSINYMLALISIYSVMFAMVSQVRFQTIRAPSFLGPEVYIFLMIIGTPMAIATLLPILVVPLLVLYRGPRGRAVGQAVTFWFVVCVLIMLIATAMDPESFPYPIAIMLCFQGGALLLGILSALPFRLIGIELMKTEPGSAESAI